MSSWSCLGCGLLRIQRVSPTEPVYQIVPAMVGIGADWTRLHSLPVSKISRYGGERFWKVALAMSRYSLMSTRVGFRGRLVWDTAHWCKSGL